MIYMALMAKRICGIECGRKVNVSTTDLKRDRARTATQENAMPIARVIVGTETARIAVFLIPLRRVSHGISR